MIGESLEHEIMLLNISYINKRLFCIYRRPLSGNGVRADLTIDKYAIWAAGDLASYDDIDGHTDRGVTDTTVNFRFEKVISLIYITPSSVFEIIIRSFRAICIMKQLIKNLCMS